MDSSRVDELPFYVTRYRIRAARIVDIIDGEDPVVLGLEIVPGGRRINVATSMDFSRRIKVSDRKPAIGDWFVVYGDGYQSWSPAVRFGEFSAPEAPTQLHIEEAMKAAITKKTEGE